MPSSRPVRYWISAGATHRGRIRTRNQDSFLDRPDLGLWAVADGMGGHAHGDRASRRVIDLLSGLPAPRFLGRAARQIEWLLAEANRQLIADAAAEPGGRTIIGTTAVAIVAVRAAAALLWVGDSRAYRLRDGRLTLLTLDHTEIQDWILAGRISPRDAENHPYSSVLSRAIGAEENLVVDRAIERLRDGDRYLLCSDGLTKELDEQQIAMILSASEPRESAQKLTEHACAAGGRDNITAVVIDFRSGRTPS